MARLRSVTSQGGPQTGLFNTLPSEVIVTKRLGSRSSGYVLLGLVLWSFMVGAALWNSQIAVVVTNGVSMNPVYYEGDLVVVAKGDSYQVGQIAAYPVPGRGFLALHRIIAGDASGFTFKGDNNQSIDPYHPTADQIVGGAVLHIPHGGQVLEFITNPVALGVVAFSLIMFGSNRIRTRRRKRREAMAQQVSAGTKATQSMRALPRQLQIGFSVTAAVALLALMMAAFAWTAPTQVMTSSTTQSGRAMTFSYTADVPQSPAYDGTTVNSPDPIFRNLTNTVDVHMAYVGDPGSMTVNAELSTPSGWHSTVPLSGPTDISQVYAGSVTLELNALDARAQAAANTTGLPGSPLTVAVVANIQTDSGLFAPKLTLNVAPLEMTISGDPKVTDSKSTPASTLIANTVGVGPFHLGVVTARILSLVLLLGSLIAAVLLFRIARRTPPVDEVTRITQRYGPLLATVEPIATPQNVPVIEVTEFATLAKLAERCGQLVMHWSRSDVETFVILDEGTTYRYRTSSASTAADDPRTQEAIEADRAEDVELGHL